MEQNVNLVFMDACLHDNDDDEEEDTQKLIDMYNDFINNEEYEDINLHTDYEHCYDESFSLLIDYNENNTVKQLQKICDYYSIKLNKSKMKKADIINLILVYENEPSNKRKVMQRKKLWFYMSELEKDKFMKQYLIW